jgi:hypothetical protein
VDNFFVDPDTTTLRDAGYILRKRRLPAWLASKQLGIEEEKLLGLAKKQQGGDRSFTDTTPRDPYPREVEMVEYTEVWSRIGVGHVLASNDDELKDLTEALESLGSYVWLAIAEGADVPLNLHEDLLINSTEKLRAAMEWPVATYGEVSDPWPCTVLDFRPNTDNAWAKSPLEPGLPLQVFIDHLYAYLMSRVIRSAKTVIVVPEDADPRLVSALESQKDLVVTRVATKELSDVMLDKLYAVIDIPPLKADVWELLKMVEGAFRMAVGLDPFLYGAQPETEPRSAATVTQRHQSSSMRANQMSRDVERWLATVSKKEGLLTRLHVGPESVSRIFAEPYDPKTKQAGPLTGMWQQLLNTDDPDEAARDYLYSIVSGSGKPRDKETETQATTMLAQTILPVMLQVGAKREALGDPNAFSGYNSLLDRIAKGFDTDLTAFRLNPAPQVIHPAQGQEENVDSQQAPGPA